MDLLETFKDSDDLADFPAGTVLMEEGAEGNEMYVVVEGQVRVTLKNHELAVAGPGEIVGEMALINSDIRSATVVTLTDCRLAVIDQISFEALLRHVPDFSSHVMGVLAGRLKNAFDLID
ncbi:Crp/Fnr family transcriptional regulator [Elongatibacter sediminis]|uniref:Cyclic nucleotide-binding domain-containing protein n=1 Tax=Elongatibacter sediminis TaxID=3119006 RepID=A0AAW9RE33_9GAMM